MSDEIAHDLLKEILKQDSFEKTFEGNYEKQDFLKHDFVKSNVDLDVNNIKPEK